MKKYLTKEEADKLFELGITEDFASYLVTPWQRFNVMTMSMEWGVITAVDHQKYGRYFEDEYRTFGIGDLIEYIHYHNLGTITYILEEVCRWSASIEEPEMIDCLYKFILSEYNAETKI